MSTFTKACLIGSTFLTLSSYNAQACEAHKNHEHGYHNHNQSAPLHIMGDHVHARGDWMISYKASTMRMEGNRQGINKISPTDIVSTLINPNAPPANVRVVPTEMTMDMHMLGAMYGVTDKFTVTAMAMYMQNEMEHITFSGMMGTTELGRFKTRSGGWGDIQIGGLYNLYTTPDHTINAGLSLGIPTGSIKEEDNVLTPMNTRPRLRLPYAMQLGSGTWDAIPSITYTGQADKWSWGGQLRGTLRLEDENSQDYRRGHKADLTIWGGYQAYKSLLLNAYAEGHYEGKIKGTDTQITAPVQTANPDNYGGKSMDIGAGFRYAPEWTPVQGIEFSAQISTPVYQNLNGVQMERDWTARSALSFRF